MKKIEALEMLNECFLSSDGVPVQEAIITAADYRLLFEALVEKTAAGIAQVLPLPPQPPTITTATEPVYGPERQDSPSDKPRKFVAGECPRMTVAAAEGRGIEEGCLLERELEDKILAYEGLEGVKDGAFSELEDRDGKLDAIAKALDMPKDSWRIAGCDVMAHQIRGLVAAYIKLQDREIEIASATKAKP